MCNPRGHGLCCKPQAGWLSEAQRSLRGGQPCLELDPELKQPQAEHTLICGKKTRLGTEWPGLSGSKHTPEGAEGRRSRKGLPHQLCTQDTLSHVAALGTG